MFILLLFLILNIATHTHTQGHAQNEECTQKVRNASLTQGKVLRRKWLLEKFFDRDRQDQTILVRRKTKQKANGGIHSFLHYHMK